MDLYKFGMDWLNGVLPLTDVMAVFEQLEVFSSKLRFDRWELVNSGKYNYKKRFCLDGKSSIQLMFNPVSDEEGFTACFGNNLSDVKDPDLVRYISSLSPLQIESAHNNNGWIFFSISGDGIRYLHSLGGDQTALNKLLFYFFKNGFKASRFDVYCDILDENNQIIDLIVENVCSWDTYKKGSTSLRTRMHRTDNNFRQYPHVDVNGEHYTNVEIGNHGSNMGMFRCYNKLDELLNGRLSCSSEDIISEYKIDGYCWRLEYEVHKDYANQCFSALMQRAVDENKLHFADIFYSVLSRFFTIIDFTTLSYFNQSPVNDSWQQFLDFVLEQSNNFVQFAPLPYIPMSAARQRNYLKKNEVFIYSLLVRLCLDPVLAKEILKNGSSKFYRKKRYNPLRDELDIPDRLNSDFLINSFERLHCSIA